MNRDMRAEKKSTAWRQRRQETRHDPVRADIARDVKRGLVYKTCRRNVGIILRDVTNGGADPYDLVLPKETPVLNW